MKILSHLVASTIIVTGLYLCLCLGNELLASIDGTIQTVQEHKTFMMEVMK